MGIRQTAEAKPKLLSALWTLALTSSVFEGVLVMHSMQLSGVGAASLPRFLLIAAVGASVLSIAAHASTAAVPRRLLVEVALLLTWVVYTCVSFTWSSGNPAAARYVFVTVFNGLIFLGAAWFGRASGPFRAMVFAPIAIALALGMLEWATGFRIGASRQHVFRFEVVGPFINPLFFAYFLASFSGTLIYRTINGTPALRLIAFLSFCATIWLLLHTGSRTGLIAAAVSSVAGALLAIRSNRQGMIGVCVAVTLVGLTLTFAAYTDLLQNSLPPVIADKLLTTEAVATAAGFAETSRGQALRFGMDAVALAPVLGGGPAYTEAVLHQSSYAVETGNINAHNWSLELLLNGGIIGFVLFWSAYVRIATLTWQRRGVRGVVPSDTNIDGSVLLPPLLALPILTFGPSSLSNTATPWLVLGFAVAVIARPLTAAPAKSTPTRSRHVRL